MTLNPPKNQWAFALRLLIDYRNTGMSMKEAMQDHFHKFQSRLLELEKGRKDKLKVRRLPMTKKNRFGHSCTFTNYKTLAPFPYLVNLYNKVNKDGVKALHN